MPPVMGMPDLVFTANAALIYRDLAVMARFRYPQRQGEEPQDEHWLGDHGFRISHLPPGMFFEGAGDALFCGDTLFAGYRIRSDIHGHPALGTLLGCRVIPLELVDAVLLPSRYLLLPVGARRGDLLSRRPSTNMDSGRWRSRSPS